MNMTEMATTAARGAYAQNGWWRSVFPDDDGTGRYQDIRGVKCRAVEWDELNPEEQKEMIQNAYHGLLALIGAGWAFVAPTTPHVPRPQID